MKRESIALGGNFWPAPITVLAYHQSVAVPQETYALLIARYEKSIADFAAVERDLMRLPASATLMEAIRLNREIQESLKRALATVRIRVEELAPPDERQADRVA